MAELTIQEINIMYEEIVKLRGDNARQADEIKRLRKALESIACGTEDEFPPYRCIDRLQMKDIATAALGITYKVQDALKREEANHE